MLRFLLAAFITTVCFAQEMQTQVAPPPRYEAYGQVIPSPPLPPDNSELQQAEQAFRQQMIYIEEARLLEEQKQTNLLSQQENLIQEQQEEINDLNSQLDEQRIEMEEIQQKMNDMEPNRPNPPAPKTNVKSR